MSQLNIFITGGTSGIGLAVAKKYLSQNHRVAVCGRDEAKFDALKDYENAFFYQADVCDREKMIEVVSDFNTKYGLDIIIASAGLSFEKKTKVPDFDRSRRIIDINLIGTLNTFEAALKCMLPKKSGHLVGIASVAGLNGFPGVSAYSASKAGVIKLCEGYGVDLYDQGIDVTCIIPGFVDTPLTRKNHHPMPFLVKAEDAAQKIITAIEKKKELYGFPFLFTTVLKILTFIPRSWFKKLMQTKKFNYSLDKKS